MHNPMVTKFGMQVISGGQTGVDVAALRAAQCMGLRTGGLAPKGWKTMSGPKPMLQSTFRLQEGSAGYSDRTRMNVEAAHVTLVIAHDFESSGTKLTLAAAAASQRPVSKISVAAPSPRGEFNIELQSVETAVEQLVVEAKKINELDAFVLNVAGNSSSTCPFIFVPAFIICMEVFHRLTLAFGPDATTAQRMQNVMHRFRVDAQLLNALVDNYNYYSELDPRRGAGLVV